MTLKKMFRWRAKKLLGGLSPLPFFDKTGYDMGLSGARPFFAQSHQCLLTNTVAIPVPISLRSSSRSRLRLWSNVPIARKTNWSASSAAARQSSSKGAASTKRITVANPTKKGLKNPKPQKPPPQPLQPLQPRQKQTQPRRSKEDRG